MNPNNSPTTKSAIVNKNKCRCFNKLFLSFVVCFIIFWLFIIFYASRREKCLDIKIRKDYQLPYIELKYLLNGNGVPVPQVLHQLWKSKFIPEKWQDAHQQCMKLNPEYKLILWTDEMIYNFIANEYPQFYRTFISYPYHIQRVDVARYFILYHYGGVYLDIDAMCKTPFNEIIANMTVEQSVLLPMTDIYGVTNSFMVAKHHSEFFKYVTLELPAYAHGSFSLVRHTTVIFSTGPMFMSHCVRSYKSPQDIFVMSICDYDDKHFYHAKGGSWHGVDTEIVDIFHFHYLQLLLILTLCVTFLMLLRYKKEFLCCCMSKVNILSGSYPNILSGECNSVGNVCKLEQDKV